jgi:hypothetical protein
VLDSRLYAMKIRIFVEYWNLNHWAEELNMILSRRRKGREDE